MPDSSRSLVVQDGLLVENGAGVFSGFDSPTFDAPIGSLYLKTDATRFIKTLDGSGGDKWAQDIPTASNTTALVTPVYNNSGALIPKGSVVYISGSQGFLPTIFLAKADAEVTSATTYGIVISDISNQGSGVVCHSGLLQNIDTQFLVDGAQLYLSPTVAGGYTLTKPSAPDHIVFIGVCTRAHPIFGTLEVSIQNGYQLDELHDVNAITPVNNVILRYNSTTMTWNASTDLTTLENNYNGNNGMGLRIVPNNGTVWYIGANYESVITRRGYIVGKLVVNGKLSILT